MGAIRYTAQRSLVTGHLAGEEYLVQINFTDDSQRSATTEKAVNRSLSGAMEVIRYYSDKTWQIVIEPVNGDRLNQLREILDSTDGGEVFEIDFKGLNTYISFKRTDSGYNEAPFSRVGDIDLYDYIQISFTALEV